MSIREKQAAPGGAAPEAPYARRWVMLPVLLAAMFMVQFDLFVVNVAAPSLERDLQASQGALELIVAGYGFTYAAGLVTGGRLGDLFGQRGMFLGGTLAFTAASLLCGLAQSDGQLVAFRLLQGLTGAAMVPQVLALITRIFPGNERFKALGYYGVAMGIGGVAGQVLGGALVQSNVFGLGWRVIFLINVPIGILAVILSMGLVPKVPPGARPRLDFVGAIGISGALALALVPLALGRTEGWPLWCWICLIASVPVLILALLWEASLSRRGGEPILDLALFRNSVFARGLIISVGVFAAFYSFMFCLTLVLQSGMGLSPLEAGWTFAPLAVGFAGASLVAPRKVAKYGATLITIGVAIAAVGMIGLAVLLQVSGDNATALRVTGLLFLIGIGNGLAVPVLTGVVLAGARVANAGAASGLLTTTQQFSSAIGVATLGSLFFTILGNRRDITSFGHSLEWVLGIGLVLLLIVAITASSLPKPPKRAG
ncbi:MFS transporter [Micromonospora sp. NPDC048935]|uniref:MFS transporter n=1 Tax=Micromonospora sp. NPDC048935 TaxID=3364262 RepID=UPI00371A572D